MCEEASTTEAITRLKVENGDLLKANSTLDRYHEAACAVLDQLESENAELRAKVRRLEITREAAL